MALIPANLNLCHDNLQKLLTSEYGKDYQDIFESLWAKYEALSHPEFQNDFLSDPGKFEALIWEMLLATKFLDEGYNLRPVLKKEAPDLCLDINGRIVWVECTFTTKGAQNKPDTVPELNPNGCFQKAEIDKSLLRCTNALQEKSNQFAKWLEKGICQKEDVLIIALNGHILQLPPIAEDSFPTIMGVLYQMGPLTITFSNDPDDEELTEIQHSRRECLKKSNDAPIETNFFLNGKNEHIDGIIYSDDFIFSYSGLPRYCMVPNINKIKTAGQSLPQKGFVTYSYNQDSKRFSTNPKPLFHQSKDDEQ